MSGAVYVNGRITPEDQAVVPVFDHGFLYGEGVYEVCRTYRGRPFLLDRHLHRLRTSAGLIALSVPHSDDEFETRISDTMAAAGLFPWRDRRARRVHPAAAHARRRRADLRPGGDARRRRW